MARLSITAGVPLSMRNRYASIFGFMPKYLFAGRRTLCPRCFLSLFTFPGANMGQVIHDFLALLGSRQATDVAAKANNALSGANPTEFDAQNPLRLWVIQVLIIIAMTQALALVTSRLSLPRVVAEVVVGIILGPTVMGRIPNFTSTIFPPASMPLLRLTSTTATILFIFLIGLQFNARILKRNLKPSLAIFAAGFFFPFGLGAVLGFGLYGRSAIALQGAVRVGDFMLFTGIVAAITAFPVLFRILNQLNLRGTDVEVVVLSAGIVIDFLNWVLLALNLALINSSSWIVAVYISLTALGYVVFLMIPGRWIFRWLAHRTGSFDRGSPTPFMMSVTLFLVFISAFFTDFIGLHAIFGAFIAGLVVPHQEEFIISLVERLEDLLSFFAPIYYTISGLQTDLSLLNDGFSWGFTASICAVGLFAKAVPCAVAAYTMGFSWRQSGAIGLLMTCKGLVGFIILNMGLQANILDPRTFSMFVVMALFLTILAAPMAALIYPPKYRVPTIDHEEAQSVKPSLKDSDSVPDFFRDRGLKSRFALVLDKVEQLPAAMVLSQLLQPTIPVASPTLETIHENANPSELTLNTADTRPSLSLHALRFVELSDRWSTFLRFQEVDSFYYNDPLLSVLRTYGHLQHLNISAEVACVSAQDMPRAITDRAARSNSQMIIIPWPRGTISVQDTEPPSPGARSHGDGGNAQKTIMEDQTNSAVYSEFIRNVFAHSRRDIALFVDREPNSSSFTSASSASSSSRHHLFLPFFGGPDDRLALSFLVQLCTTTFVTATIVRYLPAEEVSNTQDAGVPASPIDAPAPSIMAMTGEDITSGNVTGDAHAAPSLQNERALDNDIWCRYAEPWSMVPGSASSRMEFSTVYTARPLHSMLQSLKDYQDKPTDGRSVIILVGRSRSTVAEGQKKELVQVMREHGSDMRSFVPKTLGIVGATFIATNTNASLLVLQAPPKPRRPNTLSS